MAEREYIIMGRLTVEEVKHIELDILKSVREYCDNNGIRYYLCGGTLIGAIRHGGFIPWDDDIDIVMPREDYRRFISRFPAEGINGYRLLTPYTEKDCCIVFSKVYDTATVKRDKEVAKKYWKYGVDIDIFPTDGVPKETDRRNEYFRKQYNDFHIFLALVGGYDFNGSFAKRFLKCIVTFLIKCAGKLHIVNAHAICMRINMRAEQNQIEESDEIAVSVFPHYGKREIVSKDSFLEKTEVIFEGEKFSAPAGYDEYLRSVYGDYMTMPPAEQRQTHHLSDFYWKD